MSNKISKKDWDALSAYLDGQLSAKELDRLQKQLSANAELRETLLELRKTRRLLRSQPRIKPPRNFMLSRDMVGSRPEILPGWFRFTPALQFTSVIASVLLVLVFMGDLLALRPASLERAIALDNALQAMEMAEPLVEMDTEGMAIEGAPEPPPAMMEKSILGTPVPAEMLESESVLGQTQSAEKTLPASPILAAPAGEEMESEAARAPDAIAPEAPAEAELAPTQTIETFPTQAVVMLPHLESAATEEPTWLESLLLSNRYWWRVLEIFLVLLALVSGLLAVYLHRVATP
jgi:hypothetical protein